MKPHVSVVMPAYNAAEYIKVAVDSVLAQTFKDFELIIINDGSTDKTAEILATYKDKRINIITQKNKGLVASLNKGIGLAKAPLIARHDADDRSLPDRLEKQVKLFDDDPELVLAGSSMGVMNMMSIYQHDHLLLLDDPELKQELLVRSPFAHGSVVFKKSAFLKAGQYQQSDWPAEDYGLWLRMAPFGTFANIDKPLYIYRENEQGISASNNSAQIKQTHTIRNRAWQLRKQLIPRILNVEKYLTLNMGQQRIERIAANLLSSLAQATKKGDVVIGVKILRLLQNDGRLRRKCARLVLIRSGVKRG